MVGELVEAHTSSVPKEGLPQEDLTVRKGKPEDFPKMDQKNLQAWESQPQWSPVSPPDSSNEGDVQALTEVVEMRSTIAGT